ncbi:MAG: hypothetical protein IIV55_03750 [Alistipes sp.]|nr:hypothetical protein [Alistipes sp.]
MKKMLFLTLVLSAMAVGSASATNLSSCEERGPKRVDVNIVVPSPLTPCYGPVAAHPHHRHICSKPHPAKRHGSAFSHKPTRKPEHGDTSYRPGRKPHKSPASRGDFRGERGKRRGADRR